MNGKKISLCDLKSATSDATWTLPSLEHGSKIDNKVAKNLDHKQIDAIEQLLATIGKRLASDMAKAIKQDEKLASFAYTQQKNPQPQLTCRAALWRKLQAFSHWDSRQQKLALWQAEHVRRQLKEIHIDSILKIIRTTGDRIQNRFLHELEQGAHPRN